MRRVRIFVRLTSDVNDGLRSLMRYHGELSEFVDAALREDLRWIELLPVTLGQEAEALTAVVSEKARDNLVAVAQQRRCSRTRLANSALSVWLVGRQIRAQATAITDPTSGVR